MKTKIILSVWLSWALGAFALEEKFNAVDETAFVPGWETQSLDWSVGSGRLNFCGGPDRSFTFPTNLAAGAEAEAEVTVQIEKRTAPGWALAALAMRQDHQNYWHLALCEAPAESGQRHFVELSECLAGQWLAQHAAPTRLTPTVADNFAWEFGHVYRLHLALHTDGIEGRVSESDGTVRARFGYRFDHLAVTGGAPALAAAACAAGFTDFRGSTARLLPPPAAPNFPPYDAAGAAEVRGKATGYFHTEKIHRRWWLVDPNGHGFYFVSTDHINYRGHWCEKLGYSPYGRVAEQKYGSETNWAEETLRRLKAWGFNTLATGHSPSLRHHGLPHIEFLSFGSTFSGHDDLCPRTTWTGFPNVFSPDWPRYCDLVARQKCAANRADPWLLGYFLDNELEWFGKNYKSEGLFDEAWKKPAEHSAKQAWIAFLKQALPSIAAFNELFGTTFTDFEGLAADVQPQTPRNETGVKLAHAWVQRVAERYFQTCTAAVRRHDPHHLVLGCRFAGRAPEIWDIAGKYCDVVSVNIYPRIDVERGVPEKVFQQVTEWQHQAGKPLAVTEWSFPALDAGLPSRHGAGMRVDTQEQRARCFTHFQDFLFRLPFMVGSSYFMYLDEPAEGISSTFPEDSNYGLINGQDEPYAPITAAAATLNPEVVQRHLADDFEPVHLPATFLPKVWQRGLRPVAKEPPAQLELAVGRLTLAGPRRGVAWRLALDGKPVADLYPAVYQQTPGNSWTHPQTAQIVAYRQNELMTAVDMELTFPTIKTQKATAPGAFRVLMRYWIPRHGEWVASQGVSVENTDTRTWRLMALYHYLTPLTNGDPAHIEPLSDVPNYYQTVSGWADHVRTRTMACWLPEGCHLEGYFWKDAPAAFHSDIHEPADRLLKPGEQWQASTDPAFFFVVLDTTRQASANAARQIAKETGLVVGGK